MSVKEVAYAAQQELEAITGRAFKRAHIYELFASACKYKSHAACNASAVFTCAPELSDGFSPDARAIRERSLSLGYDPAVSLLASSKLTAFMAERSFSAIPLAELVGTLASADRSFEWIDREALLEDLVLAECLEAAADKGNALANYALALLYAPDDEDEDANNDYWYSQRLAGHELSGAAKDWADAYAARLIADEKYERHLRQAASLGLPDALFELADRFGDPAFFQTAPPQIDADPKWVSEVAERLGRFEDAHRWLSLAAESGNIEAMLELIEGYDQADPVRLWTWVYLAQELGTDFTRDQHEAINEDGSPYDDDAGGPCYVGGRDALELTPLDDKNDAIARRLADEMFDRIEGRSGT
jgi:TPR repeat protein